MVPPECCTNIYRSVVHSSIWLVCRVLFGWCTVILQDCCTWFYWGGTQDSILVINGVLQRLFTMFYIGDVHVVQGWSTRFHWGGAQSSRDVGLWATGVVNGVLHWWCTTFNRGGVHGSTEVLVYKVLQRWCTGSYIGVVSWLSLQWGAFFCMFCYCKFPWNCA